MTARVCFGNIGASMNHVTSIAATPERVAALSLDGSGSGQTLRRRTLVVFSLSKEENRHRAASHQLICHFIPEAVLKSLSFHICGLKVLKMFRCVSGVWMVSCWLNMFLS